MREGANGMKRRLFYFFLSLCFLLLFVAAADVVIVIVALFGERRHDVKRQDEVDGHDGDGPGEDEALRVVRDGVRSAATAADAEERRDPEKGCFFLSFFCYCLREKNEKKKKIWLEEKKLSLPLSPHPSPSLTVEFPGARGRPSHCRKGSQGDGRDGELGRDARS